VNVEVDQSGKIGKTNEDTVVAFSNDIAIAVLIPRKVKQDCVKQLRARGLSFETIYFRLFAVALYFLLRRYIKPSMYILIDVEYPGREQQKGIFI
jgi:hypothetical protein